MLDIFLINLPLIHFFFCTLNILVVDMFGEGSTHSFLIPPQFKFLVFHPGINGKIFMLTYYLII